MGGSGQHASVVGTSKVIINLKYNLVRQKMEWHLLSVNQNFELLAKNRSTIGNQFIVK